MYLGSGRIRSAGRTSGSIEITLPPALQAFTGLGCRVVVRDGLQPEIVLQPDFADAAPRLEALMGSAVVGLGRERAGRRLQPERFHADAAAAAAFAARPAARLFRHRDIQRSGEDCARAASWKRSPGSCRYWLRQSPANSAWSAPSLWASATRWPTWSRRSRPASAPISNAAWRQACRGKRISGRGCRWTHSTMSSGRSANRRCGASHEQFRAWQGEPERYEAAQQQWYRAFQCESIPGCADRSAPYE